jgi:hypothetical protein
MCPSGSNGPESLHTLHFTKIFVFSWKTSRSSCSRTSRSSATCLLRRWTISLSSGLRKVLDPFAHLAQIFLSRLRLFSNSFCTPCRVLRRLFCDFSRLENLQSSSFLCELPRALLEILSLPPELVIWTYSIFGALLALNSILR